MYIPLPLAVCLSALAFLIAATLIVSYICYRLAFKRRKSSPDPYDRVTACPDYFDPEKLRSMLDTLIKGDSAPLHITSADGLRLSARYYHQKDGAPIQIMCHGYTSTPFADMFGGGTEALKRGHNLLLIYQRAHGESEGRAITFGAKEKYDLIRWIELCCEMSGGKSDIILVGLSMGAATVLAASELDLPDNVRCIIADCPYSSAELIIKKEIRRLGLPTPVFYPLMRLGARLYGGFSIRDASPLSAVRKAKRPILLIHGEDDSFVPCDMSRQIYDACTGEKQLLTVPGAKHGTSYIRDTDTYMSTVDEFINKYINRNRKEGTE